MQNNEKHHFFIGNIIQDEHITRSLRNISRKLKEKYFLKESHWNTVFFSNMIYLGYFTTEIANIYMNNIITHLLKAISEKFSELNCEFTNYKIDFDKSFYKISLKFTDDDNYLEKIIIPYLHNNGIMPIYPKRKDIQKPSIDILYYKRSHILKEKKDVEKININIPTEKFKIDHISLIRGTAIRSRVGTPSLHDQMNLVEVNRFNFPLKEKI